MFWGHRGRNRKAGNGNTGSGVWTLSLPPWANHPPRASFYANHQLALWPLLPRRESGPHTGSAQKCLWHMVLSGVQARAMGLWSSNSKALRRQPCAGCLGHQSATGPVRPGTKRHANKSPLYEGLSARGQARGFRSGKWREGWGVKAARVRLHSDGLTLEKTKQNRRWWWL